MCQITRKFQLSKSRSQLFQTALTLVIDGSMLYNVNVSLQIYVEKGWLDRQGEEKTGASLETDKAWYNDRNKMTTDLPR